MSYAGLDVEDGTRLAVRTEAAARELHVLSSTLFAALAGVGEPTEVASDVGRTAQELEREGAALRRRIEVARAAEVGALSRAWLLGPGWDIGNSAEEAVLAARWRHLRRTTGISPAVGGVDWKLERLARLTGARGLALVTHPAIMGSAPADSLLARPADGSSLLGRAGLARGLGLAGSAWGAASGVRSLVEHGRPDHAFEQLGSAYVADVAGTIFNGSQLAFLLAPTPATAAVVVVTGVAWAGALAYTHRTAISRGVADAARAAAPAGNRRIGGGLAAGVQRAAASSG